jgi:glycosyltransferase involved in cell wall biosynthesis
MRHDAILLFMTIFADGEDGSDRPAFLNLNMKILLSAYACEPNKGSEPAVGWNWTRSLIDQGHAVHLITRSNNQHSIDAFLAVEKLTLEVSYYDLPQWTRLWKFWPGGIYLYYLLWQMGAYRLAKKLHSAKTFDRVQHSTFASFRQPSFMGGLGIPFIFGPVGGGESMPRQLRRSISRTGQMTETLRELGSALTSYDPMMLYTFSRATVIACTTNDTLAKIPKRFHRKCMVLPAIGISESEIQDSPATASQRPQFLFIGRLLYWKGVHLALRALALVRTEVPQASMKIVGKGNDEAWLREVADVAGVKDCVQWLPSVPHEDIQQEYGSNVAFVFPSLHDSGGMVVLESLAAGLPVICLKLGGPGEIVTPACGFRIEAQKQDEETIIRLLADAMISIATDPKLRESLSKNAPSRARELTWHRAAQKLHSSPLLDAPPN